MYGLQEKQSSVLCTRLKRLRLTSRLTQRQVAEMLDIDRSTYCYYETGKTQSGIEALKQLSGLYHVSIDYIVGNTAKP
ncbi:MAG TPA: helix-turn-helix transcriptional regulator [Caproiciproducens sp.]|nr:helix-turn-helix transcriptional regulator [Caproiciproducens sp.]